MKRKSRNRGDIFIKAALVFGATWVTAILAPAGATTIDFEMGGPGAFIDTHSLTTEYSGLGVTFAGVIGYGGSILDELGNFGINARSGRDFLAFNTVAGTGTTEEVSFASPVNLFSVYIGASLDNFFPVQTFTAEAYNLSNDVIGSASSTLAAGVYGALSISTPGISYVIFGTTESGLSYVYGVAFVVDDLTFTAPEPSTWAMMLLGFAGLGFAGYSRARTASPRRNRSDRAGRWVLPTQMH